MYRDETYGNVTYRDVSYQYPVSMVLWTEVVSREYTSNLMDGRNFL